ncbi:gas vesicle protein [Actinospica sp. MGRD01-02]|uniref:Gas vesicle protein n=1 Tax=Actinospica acidithermotolerans TaxID=2828514 RepID=A0A941EF95_9ACTN|nr:gas vesicle protein [Actinospica acidithermotolerans]MBR7830271.1 gas vesicle protein [Actinospica acidithermotolerans]
MSVSGGLPDYASGSSGAPANLGDILERVLDKGLVIAGDIRVNLLDIELLTVKLRLVVASLETAREVGIDWWERDPWLKGREDEHDRDRGRELEAENRRLRRRIAALEADDRRELESGAKDDLDEFDEFDEDEEPERQEKRR